MAQPSELTPSQPPPEASPDKLHYLRGFHHRQQLENGQPPTLTDATGARNTLTSTVTTTVAGASTDINHDGSASHVGAGSGGRGNGDENEIVETRGDASSAAFSLPIEPSGGSRRTGDAREGQQSANTSWAAVPGDAPRQDTIPDGGASLYHHEDQIGQNGSASIASGTLPPSTLPMSNTQPPPPGSIRQSVSYPSPTSFPSPGMPPTAQYAYPPQPSPHPDPYRASPTAMNSPMSLPSMRTLDPLQSQQAHGLSMGSPMGAPMPSPATPIYYGMPPHPYGMHPDPNALRYTLPPNVADPRIALSGGRHKKEIKRRTKTGCLTCRKRRIKCDETHPTCNNCKKSKRECLGYDPIFKQQQQPGPSNIPISQAPPTPAALVSPPTLPSSTTPHPTQPAAHHHPFPPPVVPSSYPPPVKSDPSFDPSLPSAAAKQEIKSEGGFEYSTAIDPALQGAATVPSSAPGLAQYSSLPTRGIVGAVANLGTQESGADAAGPRGGAPTPLDPLQALLRFSCYYHPKEVTLTYADLPAKKMRVDELVVLGGAAPPPTNSLPTPDMTAEILRLYYEIYVPGLTVFFETSWYDLARDQPTASNSLDLLRQNHSVLGLFASFIQSITSIRATDSADMAYPGHLETCLVWALARLPYTSALADSRQPSDPIPADADGAEARNRLLVFETLLSGETLQSNPFTTPAAVPADKNYSQLRVNELNFWYHLAQYIQQAHSSSFPADVSIREQYLGRIRSVLDGRENRDVLYSIAVLREYAPQFDVAQNEQNVPSHLDEMDPRSKLAVATRFIRDEMASAGGTTNVVRRFADLAYRAFVRPGVNVDAAFRRA